MPKLISRSGHSLELPAPPCLIGTAPLSHVPLQAGLGVRERHCTIHLDQGRFVLEDHTQGETLVNGQAVNQVILAPGDILQLGQIEMQFGLDPAEMAAPMPSPLEQTVPPSPAVPETARVESAVPPETAMPSPMAMEPTPEPLPVEPNPSAEQVLSPPPESPELTPQTPLNTESAKAALREAAGQSGPLPEPKGGFPAPSSQDEVPPNLGTLKPLPDDKAPPKARAAGKRAARGKQAVSKRTPQRKKASERKRRPMLGAAVALLGVLFAGAVLYVSRNEDMKAALLERFGSQAADPVMPTGRGQSVNGDSARMASRLASITRPAAVVAVDVKRLAEEDQLGAVPRLRAWLQQYLHMELDQVRQLVAVGATATDFSMAIRFEPSNQTGELTKRLTFKTLRGEFVAQVIEEDLVVIAKASALPEGKELDETPLPDTLANRLKGTDGRVVSFLNTSLLERGNLPFFLSDPGSDLVYKYASLSFGKDATLEVMAEYEEAASAEAYASSYPSAMQAGLGQLSELSQGDLQAAVEGIVTTVDGTTSEVRWTLPPAQKDLIAGVVQMMVDPVGAEIGSASVDVLKKEAQHLAALYHTAKEAGADLASVKNVPEAIAVMIEGVQGNKPEWKDRVFQARAYSMQERRVLEKFLAWKDNELEFVENASQMDAFELSLQAYHHAMRLATLYAEAATAGADLSGIKDVAAAVNGLVIAPGLVASGAPFHLPLSPLEKEAALAHLSFRDGTLAFTPTEEVQALREDPRAVASRPLRQARQLVSAYQESLERGKNGLTDAKDLDTIIENLTKVAGFTKPLTAEERERVKELIELKGEELVFSDLNFE